MLGFIKGAVNSLIYDCDIFKEDDFFSGAGLVASMRSRLDTLQNHGLYNIIPMNYQDSIHVNRETLHLFSNRIAAVLASNDKLHYEDFPYATVNDFIDSTIQEWRVEKSGFVSWPTKRKKIQLECPYQSKQRSRIYGKTAFIILSKNVHLLRECVKCVSTAVDGLCEPFYVVGWCSSEPPPSEVRDVLNKVLWINTTFNYSKAHNEIIKSMCEDGSIDVCQDSVFLINDDVFVDKNTVCDMLRLGEENGLVGTKLLYKDGTVQHSGIYYDHGFKHYQEHKRPSNVYSTGPYTAVTFACVLINKSLLVGQKFNESYHADCSDVEYCYRYYKTTGKKPILNGCGTSVHLSSASRRCDTAKDNGMQMFINTLRLSEIKKWYGEDL